MALTYCKILVQVVFSSDSSNILVWD